MGLPSCLNQFAACFTTLGEVNFELRSNKHKQQVTTSKLKECRESLGILEVDSCFGAKLHHQHPSVQKQAGSESADWYKDFHHVDGK